MQSKRASRARCSQYLFYVAEAEPIRQLVLVRQETQSGPGRALDLDPIAAALDLAPVLDLAGIEHPTGAFGRRCLLQVFDEIADVLLEQIGRASCRERV